MLYTVLVCWPQSTALPDRTGTISRERLGKVFLGDCLTLSVLMPNQKKQFQPNGHFLTDLHDNFSFMLCSEKQNTSGPTQQFKMFMSY